LEKFVHENGLEQNNAQEQQFDGHVKGGQIAALMAVTQTLQFVGLGDIFVGTTSSCGLGSETVSKGGTLLQ
jgi:hypothetical protein